MGVVYLVRYFYVNGAMNLSLNIVIFVFMWLGIILHGTPISYIRAVNEAIKGAGGIAVQFPLYGGIQGILISTGLAGMIAQWFISISTEVTFPLFTFISGGIINFFVPSGGGQWVVQGPINIPAGVELGVSSAKVAMSISYGDQWTNMIQPFWALPLLGIAKLGAKDIMGYCVMVLIVTGVIMGAGLLLLPGW
jgi:short-chain fatty acids transporter